MAKNSPILSLLSPDRYTSAIEGRDGFIYVMFPGLVMGVVTNIYITLVIYIVGGGGWIYLSPGIGTILILGLLYALVKDLIPITTNFFLTSAVVIAEITLHTTFLGWDCGFYYYAFLLPLIYLIRDKWPMWVTIVFNVSVFGFVLLLWFRHHNEVNYYNISNETKEILNLINLLGCGLIIIIIMAYFSRTIYNKDKALIQMNSELENQNVELDSQHKHKEILLKEIHHRVKNNLQIISSLISLQRRTINSPDFTQILDETKRRIEAIALIHQELYQDENVTQVNFKSYLSTILETQRAINPNVKPSLNSNDSMLHIDVAVPLGLITSELISNSFKHAFNSVEQPQLEVTLNELGDDRYSLIIEDNGVGLPDNFSIDENSSLGMEIISALTSQINAEVTFQNSPGARFEINFQDID